MWHILNFWIETWWFEAEKPQLQYLLRNHFKYIYAPCFSNHWALIMQAYRDIGNCSCLRKELTLHYSSKCSVFFSTLHFWSIPLESVISSGTCCEVSRPHLGNYYFKGRTKTFHKNYNIYICVYISFTNTDYNWYRSQH
jgi:hypothetical protein